MSRWTPAVSSRSFLASLLWIGSLLPAQQPATTADPSTLVEQGWAHKARGRDREAARSFAAAASSYASRPQPSVSDRIAAEGAASTALYLDARTEGLLLDSVIALRSTKLGEFDPSFADQIGVMVLEQMIQRGDDRAAAWARELGYVDDLWICGPFDNDRGAALARELPPETSFDRTATYPGKQRSVAWRRLDGLAPRGSLWLGAAFRPSDQVACVAAFALVADDATTVALHLGSSGSFDVRCNGASVHERDADRPFAFDQDAIALPLQKGENLVVVKLCHQENGPFATSMRVAAANGGPLVSVRTSADPQVLELAAKQKPVDGAAPVRVAMGARSTLEPSSAHGYDAFWLAMLWLGRNADPANDRRDHRFAAIAAADLPHVAQARMLLAASRVRTAKTSAELDENERRADYEAILAMDQEHVEAMTLLGQLLLQNTGLVAAASELAERALAIAKNHEPSRLLRADVLQQRSLGALSARELELAAASDDASVACLRAAVRALQNGNRDGRAAVLRLQQRIAARSGDASDSLALAELQLRLGARDEALAAAEVALQREPLMRRIHELRAELAESDADYEAALRHWTTWLLLCPDDDDALFAQSRLYGLLGRSDDQLEALRAAIECNPNRRDDQRYLEFLASESVPFHAAYEIDTKDLRNAPTPAESTANNDGLVHLLRQRVVDAHKNGTTSEYHRLCVRVLTEAGARAMSGYRLPYYAGEQRARLLACTIYKADGTVEEPRLRGASVALPSLRPGDVVDVQGRIDDLGPSFFGEYFGLAHFLAADDGSAVVRSELVVLGEPGRDYRFQVTGGAKQPETSTLANGSTAWKFALDGVARDKPEPYRPDARERAPLVRFTTFRSWDHFASWWWNLIRGQLETTEAMRQKVAELTRECTTQDQRIAAIYNFVSTEVRYEAWEFGVHGYKPYATSVIFDRRHGDCKDKALLLCALLSEIGVEASPVLIYADDMRSKDDLDLAMVQHFNHCIAWMPEQDGRPARFLDGTATLHPVGTLPEMDQGADVLVVEKGKARMEAVPWTTPELNNDRVQWDLELRDATLRATQVETPLGNASVRARTQLSVEPARRKEHLERQLVSRFGPVTLGEVSCSDVLDLGTPVRLQVDFAVEELGQKSALQWQLPSTFADEPLLQLATETERTTPLVLGVPRGDERTVAYRLPQGYRPASLPARVEQQSPFGNFSMSWRLQGDQIVVERKLALSKPRVEPADYPAFRDFVAALRTADSQRIVLKKEAR
ncbi:MAG: DUF3857 domain-containing protein [Planctomycetota bacterium]